MPLAQRPQVKGMFRRGAVWWFRYTPAPHAKQVRESLGTADDGEAARKALDILSQAPLEHAGEFLTEMEAYFADSAAKGLLAPTTIRVRRMVLTGFSEFCGVNRIADLTTAAVEAWVASRRVRKRTIGSIETSVFHISAFCRWLIKKNRMRENPTKKVQLGKVVVPPRRRFLQKDQVAALLAAAHTDELRFILFCGFHAGMRKMEITEARPDWFILGDKKRRGCIHIQATDSFRPKDCESRTVPLTAEFEAFVRSYFRNLPPDAIWVLKPKKQKPRPTSLYRLDFDNLFELFMERQNVRCGIHDMRRSFVSNKVIENSTLIFKLAKWTGTDVGTLQRHYAHLLADDEDIEAGV